MWFMTNGPADLSSTVNEINDNTIPMAYFLCEKMASETNFPYEDVGLLDHVAGINLWFADYQTDDIGAVIATNLTRFREEWRAGIYKDPNKKIAELCAGRLVKESSDAVNPRDVVALRRYGIFGLPELARQMKQHNSKHAFAAYLIIANQPNEYSEYLNHASQQFTNSEAKLNHVKAKVGEMKTRYGSEDDLVKKISAALSE